MVTVMALVPVIAIAKVVVIVTTVTITRANNNVNHGSTTLIHNTIHRHHSMEKKYLQVP